MALCWCRLGRGLGRVSKHLGTGAKLRGYLARPDSGLSAELDESRPYGGGPFPAVVVLHGCIGITGHFTGIADRLSSWGYVALAVDSLGPRGITDRCGVGSRDQPFDAYAARRYLSQLDFVDPARVAVLGESMGGESALAAVERDMAAQYFVERFRGPQSSITQTASSRHQA